MTEAEVLYRLVASYVLPMSKLNFSELLVLKQFGEERGLDALVQEVNARLQPPAVRTFEDLLENRGQGLVGVIHIESLPTDLAEYALTLNVSKYVRDRLGKTLHERRPAGR